MSYHDVKISKADTEFSLIVRELHGWRCEFCGKLCRVNGEWIHKLEASHYIGRAKRSTRFDLDNVRSLCFTCHKDLGGYTTGENGEYDAWMQFSLGDPGYRNLVLRANLPRQIKMDREMEKLYVRQLRKELERDGKLKK